MEQSLSFGDLESLSKNEFKKQFKKPAIWRKATAVLFLAKYKLSNGKVHLVAVPFRKANEALKCFKTEVKKAKGYNAKLTLLGAINKTADDQGNVKFEIDPLQGSMNLDYLQTYGKTLFQTLKVGFSVIGAEGQLEVEELEEVSDEAGEQLTDRKLTNLSKSAQKRAVKADRIAQNLSQFEKAMGQLPPEKLDEKLALYEQTLNDLEQEANMDGKISSEEQERLNYLQQQVQQIKTLLVDVTEAQTLSKTIQELVGKLALL